MRKHWPLNVPSGSPLCQHQPKLQRFRQQYGNSSSACRPGAGVVALRWCPSQVPLPGGLTGWPSLGDCVRDDSAVQHSVDRISDVPPNLVYPHSIGVRRHARNLDPASRQLDEE